MEIFPKPISMTRFHCQSSREPASGAARSPGRVVSGFTRVDLAAVLGGIALITAVAIPMLAEGRGAGGSTQCLSNLRRLMAACQLYARDNQDYVPHPTWGADLTGPDGWAYATANRGRLPGLGSTPRPMQRESQKPWRTIGQLWSYLQDGVPYECPDDLLHADPTAPQLRDRPVQITSYNFTGMLAGYPTVPLSGDLTYKISQFLPTDIVSIEPNEWTGFLFNDAGFNPDGGESLTLRHGGTVLRTGPTVRPVFEDRGGNVGRIDGGAEFLSHAEHLNELNQGTPSSFRTRFRCYPTK